MGRETAAVMAIASVAVQAGTATAGFMQSGKSKKIMKKADADADAAMKAAKDKLEINYARQLGIAKEPYEIQRDTLLQAKAQQTQAGVEAGPRLGARAGGKGVMDMQRLSEAQRANMSREIMDIKKAVVQEDSRLRDAKVAIDLGELQGSQLEAAEAEAAMIASRSGAIKNVAGAITTGINALPLFGDGDGAGVGAGLGEGGKSIIGDTSEEMVSNYLGQPNPNMPDYSTFGMNPITDPYSMQTPNLTGKVDPFAFWNTPAMGMQPLDYYLDWTRSRNPYKRP